MSTFTIVLYAVDVVLICMGITFKILTKKRMGGKKKKVLEKDLLPETCHQIDSIKTHCEECPYHFAVAQKKKTLHYCNVEDCLFDDDKLPFYPDELEVNENE